MLLITKHIIMKIPHLNNSTEKGNIHYCDSEDEELSFQIGGTAWIAERRCGKPISNSG